MLKEALEYLVSLRATAVSEIDGEHYSTDPLYRIERHIDRPNTLKVSGLDSLAQLVRNEADKLEASPGSPLFLRVGTRKVEAYTSLDETMTRSLPYAAECDAPSFNGGWTDHETAIIRLRSIFAQDADDDLDYVLDLLSSISAESAVSSTDNGVSQTVEARQGVALKTTVRVKPRVRLTPYRTFLEVEQPTSEFLLRLDKDGRVGILEADGGVWQIAARQAVADYLSEELDREIADGLVVVMV